LSDVLDRQRAVDRTAQRVLHLAVPPCRQSQPPLSRRVKNQMHTRKNYRWTNAQVAEFAWPLPCRIPLELAESG
jgi:hypothetical protein